MHFADAVPPTAALTATSVTTGGGVYYWFQVAYSDNAGINYSTIGGGDVEVSGPGGFLQSAVLANLTTSGGVWTTTYRITAPGGTFGAEDNGAYTVTMKANEVSDTSGNSVAAGPIGSGFQVNIPGPVAPATSSVASSPFSDVAITPVRRATAARSGYGLSDLLS